MTANQIISRMRNLLKQAGAQPYSDGFAVASGTFPLLDFANAACDIFVQAGYSKADFPSVIASGVREYSLDITAGKIDDVQATFGANTYTLRSTTIALLNARVRGWRNPADSKYAPTAPRLYYTDGDRVGLYPMPLVSGALNLRAAKTPAPLVSGTDVPTFIPAIYHGAVPILGAALVALSDSEDDSMPGRAQGYMTMFQQQYPDIKDLIDARSLIGQMPAGKPNGQDG